MQLEGRRILITGAASGIGRAIARRFVAEGAAVGLIDVDAEGMDAAKADLATIVPGAISACAVADVTDPSATAAAVDKLAEELGGLDGLVNSAGVDLIRPFRDMTAAEWNRVIAINLTGPANVCRAALPHIAGAGGGTIVNIASGAALLPLADRTAYCASKAGLAMFAKALAIDVAADKIRVNSICPGAIDTPMLELSYKTQADPKAALEKIAQRYALRRIGEVEDVAAAALFLTGDESSFVTGTAMAVDGGRAFH
jgi:NAD(P)-dependent dehydrogenase (short-subunit alcohol dehydrogenase family)